MLIYINKGFPLALKENLDAVKQEISTEEQFLESVIKGERFFKKYKFPLIGGVGILLAIGIGYGVMSTVNESNIKASNEAYNKLLQDPKDSNAIKVLKEKSPKLYQTYKFYDAIKTNDNAKLEALIKKESLDNLLKDLANYQLGDKDVKIAEGLSTLIQGYELLKEGKGQEAKVKFSTISLDSPLQNIVKNLEHYQGK